MTRRDPRRTVAAERAGRHRVAAHRGDPLHQPLPPTERPPRRRPDRHLAGRAPRGGRGQDDHLALARDRSAAAGDRRGLAQADAAEGFVLRERGRPDEAVARLRAALVQFRTLGDRYAEADATRALGHTYRRAGSLGPAVDCYRRALELFASFGDPLGVAYCQLWEAVARSDEPGPDRAAAELAEVRAQLPGAAARRS